MTCTSKIERRPLAIMAAAMLLRLLVPMLAKIAGNRDPMENAISHVFGQQSICVAMDFPGWMQAAALFFMFSGLLDGIALMKIYRIALQDRAKDSPHPPGLLVFFAVEVIAYNLFSLVAVSNPTLQTDSGTVLMHTLPYVVLQVARISFSVFLLTCLPPTDVSRGLRVGWYFMGILNVVSYSVGVFSIVWSFAELMAEGIDDAIGEAHDFPFERYKILALNEYMFTLSHLWFLLAHPLAWRGHEEKEAVPDTTST